MKKRNEREDMKIYGQLRSTNLTLYDMKLKYERNRHRIQEIIVHYAQLHESGQNQKTYSRKIANVLVNVLQQAKKK